MEYGRRAVESRDLRRAPETLRHTLLEMVLMVEELSAQMPANGVLTYKDYTERWLNTLRVYQSLVLLRGLPCRLDEEAVGTLRGWP